jgi:hypothetical protein
MDVYSLNMHGPVFFGVEFIAILIGVILVHKFVYCRKRKYDTGSLYLSVLAATFIWVMTVCMHEFGIGAGFIGGIAGGAVVVTALDRAVGFLHNSGY